MALIDFKVDDTFIEVKMPLIHLPSDGKTPAMLEYLKVMRPDHWLKNIFIVFGHLVALALLGTVIALLVPVLSRTSGLRDQVDSQEEALSAVANLLERATLIPTPTEATLLPLAQHMTASGTLQSPEWNIVSISEANPEMIRVVATLSWQARSETRNSVTLVRWYPGATP